MAPEPVNRLLGQSPELAPLAERLKRIERLQERYRTVVPGPLAAASRVCAIEGTTVVVCATGGTIAAALRQIAPRLLLALRQAAADSKHPEDQHFTEIRIEVQVAEPVRKTRVVGRGPMPRQQLADLAGTLADSPLKETLERLAADDQSITRTRSKT